jgi:hypothetical protein
MGVTAAFFIAAVSFLGSVGYTVVWFSGMVVLAARERRLRVGQRELVRATVVPELEARRGPIRVVASSGRRALPSAERVG